VSNAAKFIVNSSPHGFLLCEGLSQGGDRAATERWKYLRQKAEAKTKVEHFIQSREAMLGREIVTGDKNSK
jgi:hypothetical protein